MKLSDVLLLFFVLLSYAAAITFCTMWLNCFNDQNYGDVCKVERQGFLRNWVKEKLGDDVKTYGRPEETCGYEPFFTTTYVSQGRFIIQGHHFPPE